MSQRTYSPSPLRALVSSSYSNKHHHHQTKDLVLGFSMRHYRGSAAPRHWHRNGEFINPGNKDKDLDEKAARKMAKYRELYGDHRRQLDFLLCQPSPALLGGFIASCCACCSYTRTGRRRASLRFLTMGTRNHTHLGLLTAALLSSTLSRARHVSW